MLDLAYWDTEVRSFKVYILTIQSNEDAQRLLRGLAVLASEVVAGDEMCCEHIIEDFRHCLELSQDLGFDPALDEWLDGHSSLRIQHAIR